MDTTGLGDIKLSERQQFWFDHISRCQAEPGTIKDYAAAHGFHWPNRSDSGIAVISGQQLNWLLDGDDIARMHPHERPCRSRCG